MIPDCGFGQFMADRTPRFDNQVKKKVMRPNQVMSKGKIIRADKRKKVKYL